MLACVAALITMISIVGNDIGDGISSGSNLFWGQR